MNAVAVAQVALDRVASQALDRIEGRRKYRDYRGGWVQLEDIARKFGQWRRA